MQGKDGNRQGAHQGDAPKQPTDATDEFEVYERPAQPGEPPKARGLRANHPPTNKTGIPTPMPTTPAGPPPPKVVAHATELFEEYRRPDGTAPAAKTSSGTHAPSPSAQTQPGQPAAPAREPIVRRPETGIGQRAHVSSNEHVHDAADADARADLLATEGRHTPSPNWTSQRPTTVEMPAARVPWEAPVAPTAPQAPATPQVPANPPAAPVAAAPAPASVFAPPQQAPAVQRPHPAPTVSTAPAMPATPGPIVTVGPAPGAPPSVVHASDAPTPQAYDDDDGPRIALIQADFNFDLTSRMAEVARTTAKELGARLVLHVHAPGVFDVPLLAKFALDRAEVDALVVVGVVIQGETGHDEIVARECARKLADLAFALEKPVGLAVTGPRMTAAQAEARVDSVPRHAVESVVQQWRVLQQLGARPQAAE